MNLKWFSVVLAIAVSPVLYAQSGKVYDNLNLTSNI